VIRSRKVKCGHPSDPSGSVQPDVSQKARIGSEGHVVRPVQVQAESQQTLRM
jgi:hypothetical protein